MFFMRRLRPLDVSGERVRVLRLSLNTPVLSAPDLPVGPARAAIVVHREARGRMDVTVGVRSLRGGEMAFWSFDGALASEDDVSVASDAALNFAESLGFLFDDDTFGAGAEAGKAWQAWHSGEPPALAGQGSEPGAGAEDLLELEELVEEAKPMAATKPVAKSAPPRAAAAPPRAAPLPARSAPPPARPALVPEKPVAPPRAGLSKFRAKPAAPVAPAESSGSASKRQPLARVQLVKRRSPEEERKLLLRKLLTSF